MPQVGKKWLPAAERDGCEPQKCILCSKTVEMTKYVGPGDQKKVGVFTGRSIEWGERGEKRSPSWDVLRGRGLWSSPGDSGRQGWSSGERAGLDTWMRDHGLGNVRWVPGALRVPERGRRR